MHVFGAADRIATFLLQIDLFLVVHRRNILISFVTHVISMLMVVGTWWLQFHFCDTVQCSSDCILLLSAPTTDVKSDLLVSPPLFVSLVPTVIFRIFWISVDLWRELSWQKLLCFLSQWLLDSLRQKHAVVWRSLPHAVHSPVIPAAAVYTAALDGLRGRRQRWWGPWKRP